MFTATVQVLGQFHLLFLRHKTKVSAHKGCWDVLVKHGLGLSERSDHRVHDFCCCAFLFQRIKVEFVWTCTLVISLFVESCHAQKVNLMRISHLSLAPCVTSSYQSKPVSSLSSQLNIHWSPQSMMYLKGKREFNCKVDWLSAVTLIINTGDQLIMSAFIIQHTVKCPNLIQM